MGDTSDHLKLGILTAPSPDRSGATDSSAAALAYSLPSGAVATRHSFQIDTRVTSAANRSRSIKQRRKGFAFHRWSRTPRSRERGPYVTLSASSNISSVKFSTQSAKTSRIGWVLRNERPEMLIPTVTLLPRASRMKRYSPKGSH